MSLEINDNDFLRQFEVKIDGKLAKIEYALQERKIFLTKLVIPESVSDDSFTDEFIRGVLSKIGETNRRVVPTSPQIAKFLRKHKMIYKDLLPVGIRI
ncbi:hypothetical protein SAMN05216480_103181 [Pustulibacterium marinum]|uniref:N-acetyltransferase domain-containing protein n=1 Tax=Pustulibacterium marinum TaxID=1224947 RepID=A0A1I7G568_9FLAO|nr:N-acetyltransferase [Pustulibacterium marinum]SFU43501.1 hypothetical protein SAMN05216480_103181 [Pustulibacterium marinum]